MDPCAVAWSWAYHCSAVQQQLLAARQQEAELRSKLEKREQEVLDNECDFVVC